MRSLILTVCALTCATSAWPCSCFSPEMRAKTARDTLELARMAVYGRVAETRPDGSALFVVIEAFKGAEKGQSVLIEPGDDSCTPKRPKANAEILLLSFDGRTTACGAYDSENVLLQEFRAVPAK